MANYFPALDLTSRVTDDADIDERSDPALVGPPVFRNLAQVQGEIRAAVEHVKVAVSLDRPHPIVARLLKQDESRPAAKGPYPPYDSQKFVSAIQQRRLRVLSSILNELQRLGCKVSGSAHAGEQFSVSVGGRWTCINLTVEGASPVGYFSSRHQAPKGERERLRFDIVDHGGREAPKRSWREDKAPLERQATYIVQSILLQVEEDQRALALMSYKWHCEDYQRRLQEARLAAEKAELDRIKREEAAAAARIDALIDGADALERAARIRRYVAAVTAAYATGAATVPDGLEQWVVWGLSEADRIDPIKSRRFVTDLDL
ncbi:hypothetical protein [Brevundimonas subvibrioides]|uniref:hypothetical protein n=1 Tax=Brevundimonas subvibrioides TaxID=74313 RepID=UPI0022B49340|nr:hypothetical protein [Brevundimonas subvibrioides]